MASALLGTLTTPRRGATQLSFVQVGEEQEGMAHSGLRLRPQLRRLVVTAPLLLIVTANGTAAQQHAYVANLDAKTVSVIDVASRAVIATVPAGNNPDGIVAPADGRYVYVANFLSNDVSVIETSSNTSTAVAGTQNDLFFDAQTPIGVKARNRPDCTANPAINKSGASFGFQPPGCRPGVDCTGIRAIVYAVDNNDSIADGSELYRCNVTIATNAMLGSHALRLDRLIGSTPDGQRLNASGIDGAVVVSGASAQLGSGAASGGEAMGCNVSSSRQSPAWYLFVLVALLLLRRRES